MDPRFQHQLRHAIIQYDTRQKSSRTGYNLYALPQYMKRLEEVFADIEHGADPRAAIVAGFTGRLCDRMLKAVGLPITTREEQRGGFCYSPVSSRAGNARKISSDF
jgi:hypothetical protein